MFKIVYFSIFVFFGCSLESSAVDEHTTMEASPQLQHNASLSNEQLSSVIKIDISKIVKHHDLILKLLEIEDSRCATGVTCIWAGQIVVSLEVSNGNNEKQTIKLVRKREPIAAQAFGYRLLLLDVAPHPKKGKITQLRDQTVTLKLIKQP
ncbi:hypothetical protein [Paraglaciecola arctica]|uniref:hypothetical protein n=1 Tax=Paraglaciecola arctica TaxID=1128911 RepID=UPI001C0696FB|nr:hypothetical protein [Paraglaciecola arctica]MBU3002048.1 hypothetical protein [Paraglaciecola arctica]